MEIKKRKQTVEINRRVQEEAMYKWRKVEREREREKERERHTGLHKQFASSVHFKVSEGVCLNICHIYLVYMQGALSAHMP